MEKEMAKTMMDNLPKISMIIAMVYICVLVLVWLLYEDTHTFKFVASMLLFLYILFISVYMLIILTLSF